MSNRRGMFLGDGSGEYDTLATLHQLAATDSEEEGEEADYALVDSSSGDDSYHSDNDEIAEYWDPYREPCVVEYCTMSLCMVRECVCTASLLCARAAAVEVLEQKRVSQTACSSACGQAAQACALQCCTSIHMRDIHM